MNEQHANPNNKMCTVSVINCLSEQLLVYTTGIQKIRCRKINLFIYFLNITYF